MTALFCALGTLPPSSLSFAQAPPSAATIAQASAAFTSHPVSSVALTGQATRITGATTVSGSVVLTARADGSWQVAFTSAAGTRTEQQSPYSQLNTCGWTDEKESAHTASAHNCMMPLTWFLPMLSLAGGQQPPSIATLLPSASPQGIVLHQTNQIPAVSGSSASLLSRLSAVDVFFDAATFLPKSVAYNLHPDDAANIDVPVQVLFEAYQTVDGVSIPFHIQRFVNGVLALDIYLSSASLN